MFQHVSLRHTDHRPWPMPETPWVIAQRWSELLFLHWPVPAETLRPLIPEPLEIEQFDGTAWIGVVPFQLMIRPRGIPPIPGLSTFPEINLRTYVRLEDRPGVWFFSLDAASRFAVRAARRWFHLPYFDATFDVTRDDSGRVSFRSSRLHHSAAVFDGSWKPTTDPVLAPPGTLDHWLTERYCLYASSLTGRISRTEVHHAQWPLQEADVDLSQNSLLEPIGLEVSGPPIARCARSIDVVNWRPVVVARATQSVPPAGGDSALPSPASAGSGTAT